MSVSAHHEVRTFYDDSADDYSRMMDEEIELPLYAEVLGGLVQRMASLKGPLLDTSCGSGHMLAKLADQYPTARELVGVDLSPKMVAIAKARLGAAASVYEGDMANLPPEVAEREFAAVISFSSLHHVAPNDLAQCVAGWHRVLTHGGQLVLATWEGEGAIDYGGQSDIVTQRYREAELVDATQAAGFAVDQHLVIPVDGMDMDAVYLAATKGG